MRTAAQTPPTGLARGTNRISIGRPLTCGRDPAKAVTREKECPQANPGNESTQQVGLCPAPPWAAQDLPRDAERLPHPPDPATAGCHARPLTGPEVPAGITDTGRVEHPPSARLYMWVRSQGRGASLVAQWLRIRLPVQGTWVRALAREDPTCCGATKPVRHKY